MAANMEGHGKQFDEVTALIIKFSDLANEFGLRYKVASEPYVVSGLGSYRVARLRGSWELLWLSEGEDREFDVRTSTIAVKRKFLVIAEDFFLKYKIMAEQWESTIDDDIKKGRETLDKVCEMFAQGDVRRDL